MSDNIAISKTASVILMLDLLKGYNENQKKELMTQIVESNECNIGELTKFLSNVKDYYHPKISAKVGDYIFVNTEAFWESRHTSYYKENNLINNGFILVQILAFKLFSNNCVNVRLNTIEGFIEKDVQYSYLNKIDLL